MHMRRIYVAFTALWLSVASLVTLVISEVQSRPLPSCIIPEDN